MHNLSTIDILTAGRLADFRPQDNYSIGDRRRCRVLDGGESAEFTFRLPKLVGRLKITSVPAGAQITVAGRPRGKAPVDLGDLAPGEYQVSAQLTGYRDAEQTVEVKAHDTTQVELQLSAAVYAEGDLQLREAPGRVCQQAEDPHPRRVAQRLEELRPVPAEPVHAIRAAHG